jgi:hypothetical protein
MQAHEQVFLSMENNKIGQFLESIKLCLTFVFLMIPLTVLAEESVQKSKSLDTLDQIEQIEKVKGNLKELEVLAASITTTKYIQCLKVVGSDPFCQCLKDNLPVGTSFDMYVTIVIATKDDLKYQQLSEEDKKLVNSTYKARDMCVKNVFNNEMSR